MGNWTTLGLTDMKGDDFHAEVKLQNASDPAQVHAIFIP
jgi:hypothetical protein